VITGASDCAKIGIAPAAMSVADNTPAGKLVIAACKLLREIFGNMHRYAMQFSAQLRATNSDQ
jgi:hypothetical protein